MQVKSLFVWWVPDDTFLDLNPVEVRFPRYDRLAACTAVASCSGSRVVAVATSLRHMPLHTRAGFVLGINAFAGQLGSTAIFAPLQSRLPSCLGLVKSNLTTGNSDGLPAPVFDVMFCGSCNHQKARSSPTFQTKQCKQLLVPSFAPFSVVE